MICDLAETYGIYDYKSFRPTYIATLAAGLRDGSRIKIKLSGIPITIEQYIFAYSADKLANLVWMQSEDGMKGKNPPHPILGDLLGLPEAKKHKELKSFSSPEEFEAELRKYEV